MTTLAILEACGCVEVGMEFQKVGVRPGYSMTCQMIGCWNLIGDIMF